MQNEDRECSLSLNPQPLSRGLDILLKLLNGILKRRPGIIHLIHDQYPLPDQVRHLSQTRQVQPLCPRHLCSWLLNISRCRGSRCSRRQLLVERQPDGLDGDVGGSGALEEGAQHARGHVATTADGDHELWVELIEDLWRSFLAKLVDLAGEAWSATRWGKDERKNRGGWSYLVVCEVDFFDSHRCG